MVRWESTPVGGRLMRIYLGTLDRDGAHAGVVVAHHAFGIERSQRTQALLDDEIVADINAAAS